MRQLVILLLTFILSCFSATCQNLKFKPSFGVTLDTSYGSELFKPCSRSVPDSVSGFWNITFKEIESLEESFKTIKTITAKDCCFTEAKVDSLETFAFQYLGVTINGKRFIYLNAFPMADIKHLRKRDYDPAKYPVVVCDGGDYYWGALFDIETKQFSHLAFNVGTYRG